MKQPTSPTRELLIACRQLLAEELAVVTEDRGLVDYAYKRGLIDDHERFSLINYLTLLYHIHDNMPVSLQHIKDQGYTWALVDLILEERIDFSMMDDHEVVYLRQADPSIRRTQ